MSKIENMPLEIDFGESFTVTRVRQDSDEIRIEERRGVQFQMNRKPTLFGEVAIDHWWIPLPGLYADRNRESQNHQEILDCYWGWCQHAGSAMNDRHVQESYILAKLLPEVRSNGARRVFCDAIVTAPTEDGAKARYADLPTLNSILASSSQDTLESEAFIRRTAEILGPPRYDDEARECYREMTDELFKGRMRSFRSWQRRGNSDRRPGLARKETSDFSTRRKAVRESGPRRLVL